MKGVLFQSACTGLWYEQPGAAGTIQAVRVDDQVFLPMPYRLTAENGAKARMMGEVTHGITEYDHDGNEQERKVPVPWHTMKEIYNLAVRWFLHERHKEEDDL